MAFTLMISGYAQTEEANSVDKDNVSDIVKAKRSLKQIADKEFSELQKKGKYKIDTGNETNRLLATLALNPSVDRDSIEKELKTYGVYVLENNTEDGQMLMSVSNDNSDISMTPPFISYNSSNHTWTVIGGGYWKNRDWLKECPFIVVPYVGKTITIGGKEGFGVGYTSISGTYNSSIISQYGMITDNEGHTVETTSRSDGDGSKGFGFQLQDYVRINTPDDGYIDTECSYIGSHFAATATYSSNFVNLNGVATSYYIHTSDDAKITSVNFGISGKSAGVNATIENVGDSFPAYSTDTRF